MTYALCKKLIIKHKEQNNLDAEDMAKKLDVFLLNNRITEEEYNELINLMK